MTTIPTAVAAAPPVQSAPASVPAPRRDGAPLQLRPLRLRLRTAESARRDHGLVDGAWWPYTDDLLAELEPLLAGFSQLGHLVHRVSYSLGAWQPVPRRVHAAGNLVHLGGYRTQSRAVIHLIDSAGTAPIVLVVIPPDMGPGAAHSALELAATNATFDAGAILAAASDSGKTSAAEP